MSLPYPDDHGLKEQVRPFDDTLSAAKVILDATLVPEGVLPPNLRAGGSVLVVGGERYDMVGMKMTTQPPTPPMPPPSIDGYGNGVSGEFIVEFKSQKLFEHFEKGERKRQAAIETFLYGPRWKRELMWVAHNLIAHPISEITHWLGYLHPAIRRAGLWLHDATVPAHAPNTGRG